MIEVQNIPFIETVAEESRPAVTTFINNTGAAIEDLANYKTFDEFLGGYKPKAQEGSFSWKKKLNADLVNSPTMLKFEDTPEGLGKAIESHLSLEKLLGHEKIPIPKDDKDTEGWARLSKALGVPEKADGYGLPDAEIPADVQGMTFDKGKFAEVVHQFKLTPTQAKGLWGAYTELIVNSYKQATQKRTEELTTIVNGLRGEWGAGYDMKVDLGQTVINKFAPDESTANYLTSVLTKDPRAIKFLATIGEQFAENNIPEFTIKKFSKTPAEAQAEYDRIMADPNHPYLNTKADQKTHDEAVKQVNNLLAVIQGKR